MDTELLFVMKVKPVKTHCHFRLTSQIVFVLIFGGFGRQIVFCLQN